MSSLFIDDEHSQLYIKYRPTYPDKVYDVIFDKLSKSRPPLSQNESGQISTHERKWELGLDIGCGTGVTTLPLIGHFENLFGIDSSQSQITQAKIEYGNKDPSKLTYLCQDCSNLTSMFRESSVDLITTGTALHWFDRPKFFAECNKVLKPGGIIVAYAYGMHTFDNERDTQLIKEFYEAVNHYKDDRMLHVLDSYDRIFPQFQEHFDFAERDDSVRMVIESTLDEYAGFLSTWAMYREYRVHNPDSDPLKTLYEKSKELYPDPSMTIKRYNDVFMLFGRKA